LQRSLCGTSLKQIEIGAGAVWGIQHEKGGGAKGGGRIPRVLKSNLLREKGKKTGGTSQCRPKRTHRREFREKKRRDWSNRNVGKEKGDEERKNN